MSNTKYPKEIFIKDTDLFDGHTRKPENSFSCNMYVTVNPWFEKFATRETAYYHIDYLNKFKKVLAKLGPWASAAQEDPKCCQELKDIFLEVIELDAGGR